MLNFEEDRWLDGGESGASCLLVSIGDLGSIAIVVIRSLIVLQSL